MQSPGKKEYPMNPWIMAVTVVAVAAYFYYTSDTFQLKCVIARSNGKTYCVRDTKNILQSADLLASAVEKMQRLVDHLKGTAGDDPRVKRLVANFNPSRIVETLPTSEHTAYSEDKGRKLAFCLRKEKGGTKLIDENTLMFVALHELSHLCTESVGHEKEFWKNFQFLLKNANRIGIYEPVDYAKAGQPYCGMTISDNPLYDLK
jgi:hypothetical protein